MQNTFCESDGLKILISVPYIIFSLGFIGNIISGDEQRAKVCLLMVIIWCLICLAFVCLVKFSVWISGIKHWVRPVDTCGIEKKGSVT